MQENYMSDFGLFYVKRCDGGCENTKTYKSKTTFEKSTWRCGKCAYKHTAVKIPCKVCGNSMGVSSTTCRSCNAKRNLTNVNEQVKSGNKPSGFAGKVTSDINKKKLSERLRGKWVGNLNVSKRLEVREKIRKSKLENNYIKGKKLEDYHGVEKAEEIKKSRREVVARQRVSDVNVNTFYNKNSIKYIEDYGRRNGYSFKHAENGGETPLLGYWLDGYDKENNVVIEFYERYHYNTDRTLRKKDLDRERRIKEHLNCKFVRIHGFDKNNVEYEVI